MSPFIDFGVDRDWFHSPWVLGDDDAGPLSFSSLMIQSVSNGFIGDQSAELHARYRGRNAHRVIALPWQKLEAHEIAEGIGQRQDFGGPTAL